MPPLQRDTPPGFSRCGKTLCDTTMKYVVQISWKCRVKKLSKFRLESWIKECRSVTECVAFTIHTIFACIFFVIFAANKKKFRAQKQLIFLFSVGLR